MVACCAIPFCTIRFKKKLSVKCYCVPFNKTRRLNWCKQLSFLRRYNDKQLNSLRICSRHFLPEHISKDNKLTHDALPTLHMPSIDYTPYIEQDQNLKCNSSQTAESFDVNIGTKCSDSICNDSATESTKLEINNSEHLNTESTLGTLDVVNNTVPEAGTTVPEAGTTVPAAGTTVPEAGTTVTEAGTTVPEAGTTVPGAGTTVPEPGTTQNRQLTSLTPLKFLIVSDELSQTTPDKSFRKDNYQHSLCLKLSQVRLHSQNRKSRKQKIKLQQSMLKSKLRRMRLQLENLNKKCNSRKIHLLLKKYSLFQNFGKILINSQLYLAGTTPKRCRYSNDEKVFLLSLYKFSPKCYLYLRKYIPLPHICSVISILDTIPFRPGINDFVFQYLSNAAKYKSVLGKQCILLFKEIPLTRNLYFNFHTGVIEGFQNLGSGKRNLNAADKVLVFMLRGLISSWTIPIAFYYVLNDTIILTNIIKEVLKAILKTGFNVRATVSTQEFANVAAVESLTAETHIELLPNDSNLTELFYYKVGGNKIYHIFDVPHLLKCFRNNFQKKDVIVGNQRAKWKHVESLYRIDGHKDMNRCSKLTEKHINPQASDKTNVILAAQVFSREVSTLLQIHMKVLQEFEICHNYSIRDYDTDSGFCTAEILMFMNNLFDSLNGFRYMNGGLKNALSYNSEHIEFWNHAIKKLESMNFDKSESDEEETLTLKHFVHNIKTIQLLWADLQEMNIKFLSLRRLNQEPLEQFLSEITKKNTFNPDCKNFTNGFKTLFIDNIDSDSSLFSNGFNKLKNILNVIKFSVPEPTKYSCYKEDLLYLIEELCKIEIPSEDILHSNTISYIADAICNYLIPILSSSKCDLCNSLLISNIVSASHVISKKREESIKEEEQIYPSNNLIKLVKHCIYFIESLMPNMCCVYIYPEIIAEFKKIDTSWYTCKEHKSIFLNSFWLLVIRLQIKQWCANFNSILTYLL